MTDKEEREIEQLNQGRLLRDAGQVLLPILGQMKRGVEAKIINSHRTLHGEGTEVLLACAAELSVIDELIGKITRNNKETSVREGKLHNEQRSAE